MSPSPPSTVDPTDAPATPTVSVVVNYFNPRGDLRLERMVSFALQCLRSAAEYPLDLILADGSGVSASSLASLCGELDARYLPSAEREPFAVTYNRGMETAQGEYLVWMASDIFVLRGWETGLIRELRRTGAWMAAPYLTNSDYMPQTRYWPLRMRTFRPHAMTFNLNMLTRKCYQTLGGMDTTFSGNYNDIDYLIRIRRAGGEAIIADVGQVLHLARATTSTDSSAAIDRDRVTFDAKHPELSSRRPALWAHHVRSPLMSRSRMFRLGLAAIGCLPHRAANAAYRALMRVEPVFHRC